MRVGRVEHVSPDGKVETMYDRTVAERSAQESASGAVLRRVCDISAQKVSWLWPGRIPLGKLTLFAGDPGLGKSLVTLDIAARLTRGSEWPDATASSGQPGSVIILSAEDDAADTIRPRLEAAGADLGKVHILEAVRSVKANGETSLQPFNLETDLVALQDAVASLDDVRLVVLDPISAYLGNTDSHVNAKVRGLLAPLAELARSIRVAVVAVDHLSKSNGPALYRPNGSIAFTAAARAVWLFARNPDDPAQRLMLPGKLNLAPDQTGLSYALKEVKAGLVAVTWGGPVSVSADAVLQNEPTEQRSERLEAMDWLREQLASGPVSARQIQRNAGAAGLAWSTVRRAKDALGIISAKASFEKGWSWRLPAAEDAHQTPKMLTPKPWASSAEVSTFESNGPAETRPTSSPNGRSRPSEYSPDSEGPGCTCRNCAGHFGTVAGWRAHISRGRCTDSRSV
jgi:putative DNA primase/helicase